MKTIYLLHHIASLSAIQTIMAWWHPLNGGTTAETWSKRQFARIIQEAADKGDTNKNHQAE